MNRCYLSLGSNQNVPERQLNRAIIALKTIPHSFITKTSSFHWTKAWGLHGQQDFCNLVVELMTNLPPIQLLSYCQNIEKNQGRVRKRPWGPRTLDIDIILYANRKIKTKTLTVPHPLYLKRDFVLIPLLEILANKS